MRYSASPKCVCSFILLIATTFSAVAPAAAQTPSQASRPNVLILYSDQHHHSVMGAAGHDEILTPNLDRLAEEGVRFTRCAASHPVCTPSRATMQTGMYAGLHGAGPNNALMDPPDTTYFAEIFGDAGYATGYSGKWHIDGGSDEDGNPSFDTRPTELSYVTPGERRRGYQEWLGYECCPDHNDPFYWDESAEPPVLVYPEDYDWETTFQTDAFLEFASRHSDANTPWMYFVSIGPPHSPREAPQEFLDLYSSASVTLPAWITQNLSDDDNLGARARLATYYAMVTFIDDEIGRMVDGIEALGQTEDTLIVYTSDHGDVLGSHWQEIWEGFNDSPIEFFGKKWPFANAFRIPLIYRWPGVIPAGLSVDPLTSNVDIPPTILDFVSLPVPEKMQGVSMRRWSLGQQGPERDAIYVSREFTGDGDWAVLWTGDHLYSPGASFPMLYDLQADPYETANLIYSPETFELQELLQIRLDELEAASFVEGNAGQAEEPPPVSETSGGACFIASAAYGTPLAMELDGLRAYRDSRLLTNSLGAMAVDAYYRVSPAIADLIADHTVLRSAVRTLLRPIVWARRVAGPSSERAGLTDH